MKKYIFLLFFFLFLIVTIGIVVWFPHQVVSSPVGNSSYGTGGSTTGNITIYPLMVTPEYNYPLYGFIGIILAVAVFRLKYNKA